jgi:hypothetical protein
VPNIRKDQGAFIIEPTKMENFGSFMEAFANTFMKEQERKRLEATQNQNTIEDIQRRRQAFEDMDPKKQQEMIQSDPKNVLALYDDSRILRMQGKKVPKDYTPQLPTVRNRTDLEEAFASQKVSEAAKAGSEARSSEAAANTAELNQQMRLDALKNPSGYADQFFAKYNKNPTPQELEAFIMSDKDVVTSMKQNLVGSVENKTKQSEDELQRMITQYQPKNQKEVDQLKAAANYMYGLSTSMPAGLPLSAERERNQMESRRIGIAEEQLGLSRVESARAQAKAHLDLAQALIDAGVPAGEANKTAAASLQAGALPENLNITASKKEDTDQKLQAARLDVEKAKLQEAAINKPEIGVLFQGLRARLSAGAISGTAPNIEPELQKIYALAGLKYETSAVKQSGWKSLGDAGTWLLSKIPGSGVSPAAPGGTAPPASVATPTPSLKDSKTGAPKLPPPDPEMLKKLSPDVLQAISATQAAWTQLEQQTQDEGVLRHISEQRAKLSAAMRAGDEAAVRAALMGK